VPRRAALTVKYLVSLFKDTSVAVVLAVPALSYGTLRINNDTCRMIEVHAVVTPDLRHPMSASG